MNYVLLSVEQVVAIHDHVLDDNELQGMAGGKYLDGALARVENRLNYGLVEDVFALAASYAAAVSQAHCFNDGNKRTAFQVMDLVLDLHGVPMVWETEVVGQKIIAIAQSTLDETDLADWLRREANAMGLIEK
ncbi:type II toxin-antitoxin system death-on-curing family toxin [Shewanella sp.]|uniref:type II toxin-antitoxin system death-on-curing family toxin n=1 Tax=Shewanella sp. TaxID=50422 RepID=UPI00404835BC